MVEVTNVQLIVVSNRLPFILHRDPDTGKLERKQSAGGLVTALAPVVTECKGLWIGWPGIQMTDSNEAIPESPPGSRAPTASLMSNQIIPVQISAELFDSYYNGCCNGTFWPLFHSMPDRAIFKNEMWKSYVEVNRLFADKLVHACATVQPDLTEGSQAIIWIHDYQLMTMATDFREKWGSQKLLFTIGFFLHIPFPSWDIFRIFPWADEILQGILGCDLVAFHIEDYCLNFMDCCQRCLGCRVDRKKKLIEIAGRLIRVRPLPIGIPYQKFEELSRTADTLIKSEDVKVIIGVDRMDYTKGLIHRLKGFERLLEKYPEHLGRVLFLQIAVPSRTDVKEYQILKEEIDQLTGRINGKFSTPNWSPIRYIFGGLMQEQLVSYYRDSSIALVTPLRDGMNLVAKEYVACQTNDPGVLILSPFAGAGQTMHEALLVNPYEADDVADIIHRALTMNEDERALRMHNMQQRERKFDVKYWMNSFLKEMGAIEKDTNKIMPIALEDFDTFLSNYIEENCKLLLLLDYDGTLAPFASRPELAFIPSETKRILERLRNNPDIHIAIISGRTLSDIMRMVDIEGITYAGNNGMEIMQPDGAKFVHPISSEWRNKLATLHEALDKYCHDGAWVENKELSVTYHMRSVPLKLRHNLYNEVKKEIESFGLLACDAACAVQARIPASWDQGRACIYILRTIYGLDWAERVKVIFVGDDAIDEESIKVLEGIACTFRVTDSISVRTHAKRRLSGTDSVLMLLKWVETKMSSSTVRERSNSFRKRTNSASLRNADEMDTGILITDFKDKCKRIKESVEAI